MSPWYKSGLAKKSVDFIAEFVIKSNYRDFLHFDLVSSEECKLSIFALRTCSKNIGVIKIATSKLTCDDFPYNRINVWGCGLRKVGFEQRWWYLRLQLASGACAVVSATISITLSNQIDSKNLWRQIGPIRGRVRFCFTS